MLSIVLDQVYSVYQQYPQKYELWYKYRVKRQDFRIHGNGTYSTSLLFQFGNPILWTSTFCRKFRSSIREWLAKSLVSYNTIMYIRKYLSDVASEVHISSLESHTYNSIVWNSTSCVLRECIKNRAQGTKMFLAVCIRNYWEKDGKIVRIVTPILDNNT